MKSMHKRILSSIAENRMTFYPHNLFKISEVSESEKFSMIKNLQESGYIKNITQIPLNEEKSLYDIVGQINLQPTHRGLTLHRNLNPKLWTDENELIPEVRAKIIQIVKYFKKAVEEDNLKLKIVDVWLLGSNANYNYTDESDLDIHIIADESFDCSEEHLAIIYNAYKSMFNKKYEISIKGINVELYVENKDKLSNVSSGVYSLKKNAWLKNPSSFIMPDIDEFKLSQEINKWENEYEKVYSYPTIKKIDNYIDGLYAMRQKSIMEQGEFGIGNLVFKEMRRCGYLDNLKDLKNKLETDELSLKENQK